MITSIVLEWFNWSKHCEEDVSRAKTTVCRNKRRVIYEEFDGRDQTIRVQEGHFSKLSGEHFFGVLEKVSSDMTRECDYSVEVDDGSC